MTDKFDYQIEPLIIDQLNDAVFKGYIRSIDINNDWVSFRHSDYPLYSPSRQEARFNLSGQNAFYAASGEYCGKVEVPCYYERVACSLKNHIVYAFDLPSFASDYKLEVALVAQREEGGWDFCQKVASYLTTNHSVSGILYQSAACYKEGDYGICLVLLPPQGQMLQEDFFLPRILYSCSINSYSDQKITTTTT